MSIKITGDRFSLDDIKRFLKGAKVSVPSEVAAKLKKTRAFVEKKLNSKEPFYGINTGFGILANQRIDDKNLKLLQENLIYSHAVGIGDPFPSHLSKLIMLLRANVLAKGYSGIRPETLDLLVSMINNDIVPIIPMQGSVGASGDLAPLSHIALAMLGKGDVVQDGKTVRAAKALAKAGLKPIKLHAKEGIALINGTQAIAGVGAYVMLKLENLLRAADIAGALSVEGDRASRRPFDPRIQKLRPHPGQIATAYNIRKLIANSKIIASHTRCKRVQDPYSFRCIPQVHGAVKDAVSYARSVILRELGSCTDNPIIFADDDEIISGGNFHGEPLGIALDTVGIAAAELASISERRVAILTTPLSREIPAKFLVRDPGLNSGLMIAHVVMSSLVSENKVYAHPSTVDSIPTSGGQEDHVSMATFAAIKALKIVENVEKVIAIEIFAACQAIDLQIDHGRPGDGTSAVYDLVRKYVKHIEADREYRHDITACIDLLVSGRIVEMAEAICGELAA